MTASIFAKSKLLDQPRFLNAGEGAIVVEFGDIVDPDINARVLSLDAALNLRNIVGVHENVPTYRSLMVHYDPLVVGRGDLIAQIRQLASSPKETETRIERWTIPCCYDASFGEDLEYLAESLGMSPNCVVKLHSNAVYRVYMYGFAPGFTYLGGLPAELSISRRKAPRPPHPANTILVGGGMSLISTFSMPTGWWLVGRTPVRMFSPAREQAFLVEVGDEIRFEMIDRATFDDLDARAEAGELVARRGSGT